MDHRPTQAHGPAEQGRAIEGGSRRAALPSWPVRKEERRRGPVRMEADTYGTSDLGRLSYNSNRVPDPDAEK